MAARKTPSKGGKPDKIMRDAIMLELKRDDVDDSGAKIKKANKVAAKLVAKAIEGDVAAIKEINERVDGKVPQGIADETGEGPMKMVIEWATKSSG